MTADDAALPMTKQISPALADRTASSLSPAHAALQEATPVDEVILSHCLDEPPAHPKEVEKWISNR